ncbi:T9SS type A sorting domain-containing protein [Flavobacterium sp. 5]|uniref:T9SS type A sorting domain-containing protein n=1 Tax=Flavobacterium sp. 5 TaxID=2035199 RepID=UPI000C2BB3DE|nr:T9SS type A sorting domain-containing protein [Flavobacterium sp. 5]PKB15579.1 putative secreted protein (Por secretion system target) [Flavobacterium sp. 5]
MKRKMTFKFLETFWSDMKYCLLSKRNSTELNLQKSYRETQLGGQRRFNRILQSSLCLFSLLLIFLSGFASWGQTITLTNGSNAQVNANEWAAVLNAASITKKALVHDNNNTNDSQFTTGSKDASILPSGWEWTNGQTNNKGDISNAGAAIIGDYLYFFGDRASINGDAQIGFWFFLNNVASTGDGKKASPFTGTHAIGDILILSNFTNGGGTSGVRVYQWVGIGGAGATDGPFKLLPVSVDDKAIVNSGLVTVPTGVTIDGQTWAYKNPAEAQYPIGAFFLGQIKLNVAGRDIEGCFSSFLLETRNSQSIDASLQDFVNHTFGGHPVPLVLTGSSICSASPNTGTITSTPSSVIGINYQLYQDSTPGAPPAPVTVQSAKAGNGSPLTWSGLASGTGYYVISSESDDATCNSTSNSVDVTITPNPTPLVANQPACVGQTATFSVTNLVGTGYTYQWKLGANDIPGETNPTYTTGTLAIGNNGNVYTAVVTKTGTSCTASDPGTLTVNPNPTASAGLAPPAECPEVGGNDFNLSGSFSNGNALWTVKAGSATNTAVGSVSSGGTTATPIVHVNGVGSVTFTLTVTSNYTPSCGTATSEVTVTVNPAAITPSLKIIDPSLCGTNPNTGSIEVCSPSVGTSYKLYLNNVLSNTIVAAAGTPVIFNGLGAGINPRIDVTTGAGCAATANCNNRVTDCPAPTGKIAAATSTKEVLKSDDAKKVGFTVFPVPFKDQLTVRYNFDYSSQVLIEVFNSQGNKILSKKEPNSNLNKEVQLNLNRNAEKNEIYFVKVTTDRESSVQKVISSR